MLQRMRDSAQGTMAKVLMGIIIVVISAFGFGAFNMFSGRDRPVAVVNGVDISQAKFQSEVEQRHRAQQGKPNDDLAVQRDALNMLIKRSLILGDAHTLRMAVSQGTLSERIKGMAAFEVDGKYSPDRMRQLLAQNGMSMTTFRDSLAEDALIDQLQRTIAESEIAVPADVRHVAALLNQKRDVAWTVVDPAAFNAQVRLTDAQLQQYFNANTDKFQQPEQVAVDYIRLARADIAATITVSDADVQAAYAAAKAAADKTQAEQRHAAHILLQLNAQRTQAQAIAQLQTVAKRIAAGASFADVARELSDDAGSKAQGGDLGFVTKGSLGEPAFDAALWAMQPGQLSAPVVSRAGVHLISLLEVRRQEFPAFAAQVVQLRDDLLQRRINDAMSAKKAELTNDAYELDPTALAKRYKIAVQRSPLFSRVGAAAGLAANREFVRVAFTADVLDGSFSSPVVTVDQDLVVFKVADHQVARPLRFAEAKESVRTTLFAERAGALANARLAAIRAEIARVGDLAVAEKNLGITWQRAAGVLRNATDLPEEIRQAAFALPRLGASDKPVSTSAMLPAKRLAVVVVSSVSDDAAAMPDAEQQMLAGSLRNLYGQRSFESYLDRMQAKATIDRRAIATEPAPGP